MSVEVGRTENLFLLLFSKVSQEAGQILLDSCRVVASEIHGLREPSFVEVPGSLDSLRIGRRIGQWDLVAAVVLVCDGRVFSENGLSHMVGFGVGEKNRLAAMERLLLVGNREVLEVLDRQRILVTEDDCCQRLVEVDTRASSPRTCNSRCLRSFTCTFGSTKVSWSISRHDLQCTTSQPDHRMPQMQYVRTRQSQAQYPRSAIHRTCPGELMVCPSGTV